MNMAASLAIRSRRSTQTIRRFNNSYSIFGGGDDTFSSKVVAGKFQHNSTRSDAIHFATNSCSILGGRRGFSTSSMPLLMIPPGIMGDPDDNDNDYYHFYNVRKKEVTKIKKRPIPGLPNDAPWIGSCHDWVTFMNPTDGSPCLVNPFYNYDDSLSLSARLPDHVRLPPLDSLSPHLPSGPKGDYYVEKLAMSAAPYDENCTVVAVVGPTHDLAFCKPRKDTKWTPLKGLLKNDSYNYSEVIYSSQDQLFYTIGGVFNDHYYFEGWDLTGAHPKSTSIQPSHFCPHLDTHIDDRAFTEENMDERRYLVEFSGDLFQVSRFISNEVDENGAFFIDHHLPGYTKEDEERDKPEREQHTYMTFWFYLFKLDRAQNKWEREYSYRDHSLFLGLNHSFSVSSCDCPEVFKQYVYYTDDSLERMNHSSLWGGHDCGINYDNIFPSSLKRIQPPPIWVNNVSTDKSTS